MKKYHDQRFTFYLEEDNYTQNLINNINKNGFIECYKKFAKESLNFDERIINELKDSLESIFQLPSLIMTAELNKTIEGNTSLLVKQYDNTHPNILETPGYIHFLHKNIIKEDYFTFQSNPVFHFDIQENLSFPVNAFVEEYIKPLHFWKSQYELILACEKLELSRYNVKLVLGIIENLPEFIIYRKNVC